MTRRLPALAAALALAGIGAALHAQATTRTAPQAVTATPRSAQARTRASLRDWEFPGMEPQSDNGAGRVAVVTGRAVGDYADVLAFYARRMKAGGYDLRSVARFQPQGHSTAYGLGISPEDGAGFCYADAQVMYATMCRRYEHESVSAYLSEDRQGGVVRIALTDTRF